MEFDCIVVLANEMDISGNLNNESFNRISLASELYKNNCSLKLITCGWNYRKDCNLYISDVMKEYAIKMGVLSESIITEKNSRDTVGDAFFTKINIIKNFGWRKILIVTSDYHVNRSLKIFRFIYGPDYEISAMGSTTPEYNDKTISESRSLAAFNSTFNNVIPGDDSTIYNRLITLHPFYNGDIYPKISGLEINNQ